MRKARRDAPFLLPEIVYGFDGGCCAGGGVAVGACVGGVVAGVCCGVVCCCVEGGVAGCAVSAGAGGGPISRLYFAKICRSLSCGSASTLWLSMPVMVSFTTIAFTIASSVASTVAWKIGSIRLLLIITS